VWIDHPRNPLISPRFPNWLVADPTVLGPEDTPDGRWALFANHLFCVHMYRSEDGVHWRHEGGVWTGAIRPWVRRLGDDGFVLYAQRLGPLARSSTIAARTSTDLLRWSSPRTVLRPTLAWEGRLVSNPCVLARAGVFWLYYSAEETYLPDMGFSEPRYIGVATSPHPLGPFRRRPSPILRPEPGNPYHDRAAGAIKVYAGLLEGALCGFQNGIYRTPTGRSASAIRLLRSRDGLAWEEHPGRPLLAPTDPAPGWRRAHVYQLDLVRRGQELWLYYNARDGWRFGVERIGLAVLADRTKLW